MTRWAYGITTVPERKPLFLQTLASLKAGGFGQPHVFVDGATSGYDDLGLSVAYRNPRLRTTGNWWMGLLELYLRNAAPSPMVGEGPAERYAMFQDDFVCSLNMREYLERSTTQEKGYWNCYLFPENERLPTKVDGWYESNQLGKGAVALVFTQLAVQTLMMSYHWVHRPMDYHRGYRAIDGGVVDSFRKAGWKELVHYPSLIQHTGEQTSIETNNGDRPHPKQPLAASFRGEDFDLLTLPLPPAPKGTSVGYTEFGAWDGERQALERAIIEDEERLKTAQGANRSRLMGHIQRYRTTLQKHMGLKPCCSETESKTPSAELESVTNG